MSTQSTKTKAEEAPVELLSATELAESLTGFDQIAIRQRWNQRFDELAEDKVMLLRALYFVHLRRAAPEGQSTGRRAADSASFDEAMSISLRDLQDMFANEGAAAGDLEDESATAERDREFAEFVVATGLSYTVAQYMELTLSQRAAVLNVASKRR